jgi:hypothetical protein
MKTLLIVAIFMMGCLEVNVTRTVSSDVDVETTDEDSGVVKDTDTVVEDTDNTVEALSCLTVCTAQAASDCAWRTTLSCLEKQDMCRAYCPESCAEETFGELYVCITESDGSIEQYQCLDRFCSHAAACEWLDEAMAWYTVLYCG